MIVWLFKEWFLQLEARHESNAKVNFVSMFNQIIRPFLQKLSEHAARNPAYMDSATLNKIHEYLTNPNSLFDDLQELVKSEYFGTVYSDRNFSLGFTNRFESTTKRYLMDGTKYKFENFDNLNDYLISVGREKQRYGAEEKSITNIIEFIRYIFHDTLFASWTRESRRMRSAFNSTGDDGGDIEYGDEAKVTRKRDSESEALLTIGPIYECIRKLYGKIAEKLRQECEEFKDDVINISDNPDVIRNLGNMKKTLHKLAIAEFISGKMPNSDDGNLGDDYVTDMDISAALTPKYYTTASYKHNVLKTRLLPKEKVSEFLENQKFKNSDMDELMRTVVAYLYYAALLKTLEISPENPKKKREVSPEMKRELRKNYLSMLPSDVRRNVTEDNLKEFSSLSGKAFPSISYAATIDQLNTSNFDDLYKELMLSYEFPTSYSVYKKDEFGGLDKRAAKEDLINNMLSPIYDSLITRELDLGQFVDEEEGLFDCEEFIQYFRNIGTI